MDKIKQNNLSKEDQKIVASNVFESINGKQIIGHTRHAPYAKTAINTYILEDNTKVFETDSGVNINPKAEDFNPKAEDFIPIKKDKQNV